MAIGTLVAAAALSAQPRIPVTTVVSSHQSIFVIEFLAVQTVEHPPTPGYKLLNTWVRVARVLRDGRGLGLTPGEFTVLLKQPDPMSARLYPSWYQLRVEPGMTYVILSNSTQGVVNMIEAPDSVELMDGRAGLVDDIQLIIEGSQYPIFEQCRMATKAVTDGQMHTRFLAEYIAVLLAAASDSDAGPLARAMDDSAAVMFSDSAKDHLLLRLSTQFMSLDAPTDTLVRTFVNSTIRCFLGEPDGAKATRLQRAILENYLRYILESNRATSFARSIVLPDQAIRQLSRNVSVCVSDERLSPKARQRARDLLTVLHEKQSR
jgi:hypothetical protein